MAAIILAAVCACAVSRAAEQPPPGPSTQPPPTEKKPFYLIVDYLPPALYAGEALTACLRVENTTGAAADVTVRAEIFDAAGKSLRVAEEKLAATPNAFAEYRKDLDLHDAARATFTLKTPQGDVAGPVVRLVRDADPWPDAEVKDGRLVVREAGTEARPTVLVPVVERVNREGDRTFAPVKWALGIKDQDAQAPVARAVLMLPGAWGKTPLSKGGDSTQGPNSPSSQALDFGELLPEKASAPVALGPYEPSGCAPVLRAFNEVLRALAALKEKPERIVIVLPPEDLEVATEPRIYRVVLEALLERLARAGVKQAVLAPPIKYGVAQARLDLLRLEVREAAAARGARMLDWAEVLDEKAWRLDPEKSGVYGRKPNAEGLKKIAQKLSDLIP
ncbi:MAG: hypothetical protein HY291_22190 [Planctomycetes bacterium]|nr:hypothetical protein [Planctomycetota bacterium]